MPVGLGRDGLDLGLLGDLGLGGLGDKVVGLEGRGDLGLLLRGSLLLGHGLRVQAALQSLHLGLELVDFRSQGALARRWPGAVMLGGLGLRPSGHTERQHRAHGRGADQGRLQFHLLSPLEAGWSPDDGYQVREHLARKKAAKWRASSLRQESKHYRDQHPPLRV